MNTITPIKHPSSSGSLPAIVNGGDNFQSLPKVIQKGIAKLLVAFPAGTQALGEGDGKLRMDVFAEAVSGFPVVVVVTVLNYLLFNNPNNPFGPTPQDIREACELDFCLWRLSVCRYASGGSWSVPVPGLNGVLRGLKSAKFTRRYDDCPPPWVAGCHLSPVTVKNILCESDGWKKDLSGVMGGDFYHGNGALREPSMRVSDVMFERIPHDLFEDGERQRVVALRQEAKHQIERELGNLKKRQEAWILDAPRREEKERTARATGERNWAEHLDRSYPIVDGRRTLGPVVRRDYRLDGYTNEMLNNALAELYETESLLQRQIPDAETFRRLVTGSAFKKLLAKQRHADPDSFRPVHY